MHLCRLSFLVFALLGFKFASATQTSPANCSPVRTAKVNITINRLHWVEERGVFKFKIDRVCKKQATVGVLQGRAGGCTYPVLAECKVPLDEIPRNMKVSGQIYHNDDPYPVTKHMTVAYHIDRNTGSITTGEAATGDIFTSDVSLKKIALRLQSKLDGRPHTGAVLDAVEVIAELEDTDAP